LTELIAHLAAILIYPGLAAAAAVGLLAEAAAARILLREAVGIADLRDEVRSALKLRPVALRGFQVLPVFAVVISLVACAQLAAPFNPVPPADRNLLLGAFALLVGGWMTWVWRPLEGGAQRLLTFQLGFLVAIYVPAIALQNLRPQVIGILTVANLLPLKAAAGLLYVICLPGLLGLVPHPQSELSRVRAFLWLPYCGLFTSLFVTPAQLGAAGEEPLGLLAYLFLTAATIAVAIAFAALMTRRAGARLLAIYLRAIGPAALATVALAMVTLALR
jgi:hypothetical protein